MKYLGVIKKVLLYGSIAAAILLIALVINSGNTENKYGDYTSYNADKNGVKALYLLAGRMDFDTGVLKRPVRFTRDGATLVAIMPQWSSYINELEEKHLKEWVGRGNTLVFIDDDNDVCNDLVDILGADSKGYVDDYGNWEIYSAGKGRLYMNSSSEAFTNEGLKSSNGGLSFIHILDLAENKRVLFNEYYHGMGTLGVTFQDIIGPVGMIIIIQLLLGLIVLAFVVSRRFGKPVTVFETIKRKENENIYALSSIYAKARADGVVLENILGKFENELAKYLGYDRNPGRQELVATSMGIKFLAEMNIKLLFERCQHRINSKGGNFKELVFLVQWIEKIRREIK